MENTISITKISKIFNTQNMIVEALPEVSFVMQRNERLLIKGHNGCGKTTLLKIIATLITPTKGDLNIFGYDLSSTSSIRSIIGYIPESLRFDYSLSATQLWKMMVALRGISGDILYFKDLMKQVNMYSWLDRPLGSFSLGMKKRTILSIWLSLEPQLLLLDEFESGLDHDGRGLIEDLLNTQTNLSIIAITHNDTFSIGKNVKAYKFSKILS